MTLDLSTDYLKVDNLETVTFTPNYGNSGPLSVANCKRSILSDTEMQILAAMGIEPRGITWKLAVAEVGGVAPVRGSWITDSASVLFTVVAVKYFPLTEAYKCICRMGAGQ